LVKNNIKQLSSGVIIQTPLLAVFHPQEERERGGEDEIGRRMIIN